MPPYTLSDPYHDFDSEEERAWLDAIAAKRRTENTTTAASGNVP